MEELYLVKCLDRILRCGGRQPADAPVRENEGQELDV
jgi:hypothetical protein